MNMMMKTSLINESLIQNLLSARLGIDFLNDKQYYLPEGDYETIAGLIISESENIPERDALYINSFELLY